MKTLCTILLNTDERYPNIPSCAVFSVTHDGPVPCFAGGCSRAHSTQYYPPRRPGEFLSDIEPPSVAIRPCSATTLLYWSGAYLELARSATCRAATWIYSSTLESDQNSPRDTQHVDQHQPLEWSEVVSQGRLHCRPDRSPRPSRLAPDTMKHGLCE